MRSSVYMAFFAGSVLAEESATVLNPFFPVSTLTVWGTASAVTTYKNSCPSGVGISVIPTENRPQPSGATQTPAPTAKLPSRRQAQSSSDDDDYDFCETYTLLQGSSTYGYHFTDPVPGAWTVDLGCTWQGAFTTADLTCTATQSGYAATGTDAGTSTTVFQHDMLESLGIIQTVAVVKASGSAAPTASATPTKGSPSGSASGTGTAAQSSGFAAAGPLPTGAMAFARGAVGILAAAFAL